MAEDLDRGLELPDANKRAGLIKYLQNLPTSVRARLEELKADGLTMRSRADFVWYFMLTSFATMGNSRGYDGLMADPENMRRLAYDVLAGESPEDCRSTIESVFRKAKIRMPSKKAGWLAANLEMIKGLGGLAAVNVAAFAQNGREAKISFLRQFNGIGDKYARNIWMDVYDSDFRNSIAVDERIKSISRALGVAFKSYEEHERFYQRLAEDAGLEPWEVDRVLYWNLDRALHAMEG